MKTFVLYKDIEGKTRSAAISNEDLIRDYRLTIGCSVDFGDKEVGRTMPYEVVAIGNGTITDKDEKFEVNILIVRATEAFE